MLTYLRGHPNEGKESFRGKYFRDITWRRGRIMGGGAEGWGVGGGKVTTAQALAYLGT